MKPKLGIKYCGGCNPDYDRVAAVASIQAALGDRFEFTAAGDPRARDVLVVVGCPSACADQTALAGKRVHLVTSKADAAAFIREWSGQPKPP